MTSKLEIKTHSGASYLLDEQMIGMSSVLIDFYQFKCDDKNSNASLGHLSIGPSHNHQPSLTDKDVPGNDSDDITVMSDSLPSVTLPVEFSETALDAAIKWMAYHKNDDKTGNAHELNSPSSWDIRLIADVGQYVMIDLLELANYLCISRLAKHIGTYIADATSHFGQEEMKAYMKNLMFIDNETIPDAAQRSAAKCERDELYKSLNN